MFLSLPLASNILNMRKYRYQKIWRYCSLFLSKGDTDVNACLHHPGKDIDQAVDFCISSTRAPMRSSWRGSAGMAREMRDAKASYLSFILGAISS